MDQEVPGSRPGGGTTTFNGVLIFYFKARFGNQIIVTLIAAFSSH